MKKILLSFMFVTLISCGNSTPDNSDAKEAARAAIIHNLKDPMSATFHQNEIVTKVSDSVFSYTETVNAKNSFGGSSAQNATVQVKWIGGDPSEVQSWSILDIQLNER